MKIQIWPCVGRAQHRIDGICPLATWEEGSTQRQWLLSLQLLPWSHINQSLPVRYWHLLSRCPSAGVLGEFLGASESVHGPFQRVPWFPATFHLTRTDRIPTDFSQPDVVGSLLPSTTALGCDPGAPHSSGGNPCSSDTPPNSQLPHVGMGSACFSSPTHLPVSRWLFILFLVIGVLFS